ncbi:protein of unknown function [Pseudomonas sp. JV241A]|nr:protein of unknown function [Pseudomonas sp. JV241A]
MAMPFNAFGSGAESLLLTVNISDEICHRLALVLGGCITGPAQALCPFALLAVEFVKPGDCLEVSESYIRCFALSGVNCGHCQVAVTHTGDDLQPGDAGSGSFNLLLGPDTALNQHVALGHADRLFGVAGSVFCGHGDTSAPCDGLSSVKSWMYVSLAQRRYIT